MINQPVITLKSLAEIDAPTPLNWLVAAGHNLPRNSTLSPKFLVTPEALNLFLEANNLKSYLLSLSKTHDVGQPENRETIAHLFVKRLLKSPFPKDLISEFYRIYDQEIGNDFAYAVPLNQLISGWWPQPPRFLKGESVFLDELRRDWAGQFTPRLSSDLITHGLNLNSFPTFLVYRFKNAPVSFRITIPASSQAKGIYQLSLWWGLAGLFSDHQSFPETFLIDWQTQITLSHQPVGQPHLLQLDRHGHLKTDSLPKAWEHQTKISPVTLLQLSTLATKLHHLCLQPITITGLLDGLKITLANLVANHESELVIENTPPTPRSLPVITTGVACSPGIASAPAYFFLKPKLPHNQKGPLIAVIPTASIEYSPLLKLASGIISGEGSLSAHLSIVARELGIPMVSGVNLSNLSHRDGINLTVDGTKGQILEGLLNSAGLSPASNLISSTPESPLATKLYLSVSDPTKIDLHTGLASDGVGYFSGNYLLGSLGRHPKQLIDHQDLKLYLRIYQSALQDLSSAFGDRPITCAPTDLETIDYRHLQGGDHHEPTEINPLIGFRGTARLLADSSLTASELDVISKLRIGGYLTHLELLLPFVRNFCELQQFKRFLAAHRLIRGPSLGLKLSIDTPAMLASISKNEAQEVDGLSINLDHLLPLLLGVDPQAAELNQLLDPRHPGVIRLLQTCLAEAHLLNLTIDVRSTWLSRYPDLLHQLIGWGLTSATVPAVDATPLRQHLTVAESRTGLIH